MADMELQAVGGERISVNSRVLTRRWGPYFIQLLREQTMAAHLMSTALASSAGMLEQKRSYKTYILRLEICQRWPTWSCRLWGVSVSRSIPAY
jgi:hypothetical protein